MSTEKKEKKEPSGLRAKSRYQWLHEHHFERIVLLLNFINFGLPLVWVNINMYIVYSPLDSLLGWMLLSVLVVFFVFGIYIYERDKSILYNLGLLAGFVPLYAFLGFWTIYHFALAAMNIVAFIVLIKTSKGRKKLKPRFKTRFGKLAVPFLIITLIIPIGAYFLMPAVRIPVEIEDNSADKIEVNWMWAEIWELDQDVIDALVYCDNLKYVEISVMVGLPEDIMTEPYYTSYIINETNKLVDANITFDFMPLLPLDDYGYDGLYINDITIDRYMETIDIFKEWVVDNNMTDKFRVICIDTELYWEKRNELYFQWWNSYDGHSDGAEKLEKAIDEMKEVEGDHPVVCATFGMHLDDFVDFDDAQQQLVQLSVFPPWNWDAVGVMIYETGFGSDYSIYSSCRAMSYYFGDAAIPYIISSEGDPQNPKEKDLEHITTKFKIIKNMGFEYTGAWALTDFLYYIKDYDKRDGKARVIGGERFNIDEFKKLHRDINDHRGKIVVYYETFNQTAIHFALQYIDVWLFNRFAYNGKWPKINDVPSFG